MIYRKESAAEAVGVSVRQIIRYAVRLDKKPAKMGSRVILLFSETDIQEMKKLRKLTPACPSA